MQSMAANRTVRNATRTVCLIAVCGMLLLTSCAHRSTSRKDLVFVDPDTAAEQLRSGGDWFNLSGGEGGVWVDPRSTRAFRKEHLPGAVHLPFEHVSERHEELSKYSVLVVYGDDYNDAIAEAMSKRLIELGHDNVKTLRGGLRAWKDAGHEVESETDELSPDES